MNDIEGSTSTAVIEITSHLICITHLNDETDPAMNNKFTYEHIEKIDSLNGAALSPRF